MKWRKRCLSAIIVNDVVADGTVIALVTPSQPTNERTVRVVSVIMKRGLQQFVSIFSPSSSSSAEAAATAAAPAINNKRSENKIRFLLQTLISDFCFWSG